MIRISKYSLFFPCFHVTSEQDLFFDKKIFTVKSYCVPVSIIIKLNLVNGTDDLQDGKPLKSKRQHIKCAKTTQ